MADRFRDLERPQTGRLKDVVLMATVTGFESLRHPSKSDLHQFAELFEPLYQASSDEARRLAVAALSQCAHIPQTTALFIGTRPIGIAAIFLTRSQAISDDVLIAIAGLQDPAYARAIARRDDLSASVVDALVSRHQGSSQRLAGTTEPAPEPAPEPAKATTGPPPQPDTDRQRQRREENLRQDLKNLMRHAGPRTQEPDSLVDGVSDVQEALLVRFARAGEPGFLAAVLADALSSSRSLAERILLDTSGQQLAMTLSALDLDMADSAFVLQSLYPHLAEASHGGTGAESLLSHIDIAEAIGRVRAWQRADGYTGHKGDQAFTHETVLAPDRDNDPRAATNRATPVFARATQDRKQRSASRGR